MTNKELKEATKKKNLKWQSKFKLFKREDTTIKVDARKNGLLSKITII